MNQNLVVKHVRILALFSVPSSYLPAERGLTYDVPRPNRLNKFRILWPIDVRAEGNVFD